MEGPSMTVRQQVGERMEEIDTEDGLDDLLANIEEMINYDIATLEKGIPVHAEAQDTLNAVYAWLSVASHVTARFYAPASPWPRRLAGWAQRVVARLQRIASTLGAALSGAVAALGAKGYSISIAFPWGLSLGLDW